MNDECPPNRDGLDDFIDEITGGLAEDLTMSEPTRPDAGPRLLIQLETRHLSAFSLLVLIQAISKLEASDEEFKPADVTLTQGAIDPTAAEKTVTKAIREEFGPALDRQNEQADIARSQGAPKAKSTKERLELRESFTDACRVNGAFAYLFWEYCAERTRTGMRWWENDLPEPLKRYLDGVLAGVGLTATIASPKLMIMSAVVVVALATHRRRTDADEDESDHE